MLQGRWSRSYMEQKEVRVWYGKGTASNSIWLEGRMYPGNYGRESRKTGKIQGRNVWHSMPENLSFILKKRSHCQILRRVITGSSLCLFMETGLERDHGSWPWQWLGAYKVIRATIMMS